MLANPKSLKVNTRVLSFISSCGDPGGLLLHLFDFMQQVILCVRQDFRLCAFRMGTSVLMWITKWWIRLHADKLCVSIHTWILWVAPGWDWLHVHCLRVSIILEIVLITRQWVRLCTDNLHVSDLVWVLWVA